VLGEPAGVRRGQAPAQQVVQRLGGGARAGEHEPPRGDARELGDERRALGGRDVLEDVEAQDGVEGGVGERQLGPGLE